MSKLDFDLVNEGTTVLVQDNGETEAGVRALEVFGGEFKMRLKDSLHPRLAKTVEALVAMDCKFLNEPVTDVDKARVFVRDSGTDDNYWAEMTLDTGVVRFRAGKEVSAVDTVISAADIATAFRLDRYHQFMLVMSEVVSGDARLEVLWKVKDNPDDNEPSGGGSFRRVLSVVDSPVDGNIAQGNFGAKINAPNAQLRIDNLRMKNLATEDLEVFSATVDSTLSANISPPYTSLVLLIGSSFEDGMTVTFGDWGTGTGLVVLSSTFATILPPTVPGTLDAYVDVVVTLADGRTVTATRAFRFNS